MKQGDASVAKQRTDEDTYPAPYIARSDTKLRNSKAEEEIKLSEEDKESDLKEAIDKMINS